MAYLVAEMAQGSAPVHNKFKPGDVMAAEE